MIFCNVNVNMMLLAGCFILQSLRTEARDLTPADAVVKTHSFLCALPESDYRGTGMLFRHQNQDYVLTSEHVILWGKDRYCHKAVLQTGEQVSLDLMASDWASGLALLKVNKSPLAQDVLPTLRDFSLEVKRQDAVETIGFPWTERNIRRDNGGRVLSVASERFFLASQDEAIELSNSHGEFGMSGSPVLTQQGDQVIGLLSHQYLKLNEGGQTTLAEYNKDDGDSSNAGSKNYLLVIPGAAVKTWLERYFESSGDFAVRFVREAEDQQAHIRRVYADGLVFTASKASEGPCASRERSGFRSSIERNPLLRDWLGLLGDPVGIGGDSSSFGEAIEIEVAIDRDVSRHLHATKWYLPSRLDWIRSMKDVLYRPGQISLTGLIYRDSDNNGVERICVSSLEEFFRKLSSMDTSPISVITSSVSTAPIEQSLALLQAKAQELEGLATHFKDLGLSVNTARWLDRMVLEAKASGDLMQWELIPVDRFRDYGSFDLYRNFWIELDSKDNGSSIELRRILIALDNTLRKMKV